MNLGLGNRCDLTVTCRALQTLIRSWHSLCSAVPAARSSARQAVLPLPAEYRRQITRLLPNAGRFSQAAGHALGGSCPPRRQHPTFFGDSRECSSGARLMSRRE
jgi:hypothetical protein